MYTDINPDTKLNMSKKPAKRLTLMIHLITEKSLFNEEREWQKEITDTKRD
jgi:hypothetical protein